MARQQKQAFCKRCGELTLHVAEKYEVPHGIHFLLTLLTCSFWLWVWLSHAVLNGLDRGRSPFLCSRCGQSEGQRVKPVSRGMNAAELAWDRERRQARRAKNQRRMAAINARLRQASEIVRRISRQTMEGAQRAPRRIDTLLQRVAGEDNDLVYRFLQLLTAGFAVCLLILAVGLVWQAL